MSVSLGGGSRVFLQSGDRLSEFSLEVGHLFLSGEVDNAVREENLLLLRRRAVILFHIDISCVLDGHLNLVL